MEKAKQQFEDILAQLDITLNGDNPWDIQINDPRCFERWYNQGSLGFGESYVDGWWDCDKLDELVSRLLRERIERKFITPGIVLTFFKAKLINRQSINRSTKVAEIHYDLGNEFYEHMLDENMQYTCAYWKDASNLNEAQIAKLDLVCKKLKLKPGERILELGSGWGGFAYHAAKNYGVEVVSYNISKEQVDWAKRRCKDLSVSFQLEDYRNATGEFDKIASVGLMEHVGPKNYQPFMALADRCLKDDGLLLVHTIGRRSTVNLCDPWIDKYIFPGGVLPSIKAIGEACEDYFVIEDLHNIGPDYDLTLLAWYANFEKSWPMLKDQYSEHFYRMWRYYLLICAGSFRSRNNQLWQIVFSKGVDGGYVPVR